ITFIKVAVVLLVIVVGAFYIKAANYAPFVPPTDSGGGGSGAQSLFSMMTGCRKQPLRLVRGAGRGIDRVLRVHRFRCRRDHPRGDEKTAARSAARHALH